MIVIKYTDGTYGALRRDLRPGQVFISNVNDHPTDNPLVVLDATTEVGLWRGGVYAVGDVAPQSIVRVIS